jgi:organic radical activating enzyme
MIYPDRDNARDEAPATQPSPEEGFLSEMFCSIQGEGPFVGERHVFVRTAGCAEACSWCDTVYSKIRTPRFVVHEDSASTLDNPVPLEVAVSRVLEFAQRQAPIDAVSITGGEPLEQPSYVVGLARALHEAGVRVYLETNGVHAEALKAVLPYIDVIAMDIKLPSAVGVDLWDAHRRFLSVVRGTAFERGRGEECLFVKVVMDRHSRMDELRTAVEVIAEASPRIELILQPESETLLSPRTPREVARDLMARIGEAQAMAMQTLESVRVMPQLHRILKVR